ncbi:MAG: hypothetical protein NC253_01710 [Ruminococcus sp.]|nr:hypothetical protein [Ruminococcus sp.]MCM1380751.1 hypothetical protein [Muribaculaceae bacterium]MCM1478711.1 hypothetical protein [Muribaculaceae bacterium]
MCNLSEGVWEKAEAKGKISQLIFDVEMLMSNGIKFDEAVRLLKITPNNADEIKEMLNKK